MSFPDNPHKVSIPLQPPFFQLLNRFSVTRTQVCFRQVVGEPLNLRFTKAPYGPYAKNLQHVLNAIEGHLVSGWADGGDAPGNPLELVPGALEDARAFLQNKAETHARFARVSDLVEGFESPFGLELLTTVHWVVSREQARTFDDVVARTYGWNDRRKQFSRRQIKLAFDVLSDKGWVHNPET